MAHLDMSDAPSPPARFIGPKLACGSLWAPYAGNDPIETVRRIITPVIRTLGHPEERHPA